MNHQDQENAERIDGSIVLEACITVPVFLMFVLSMYGLITVFFAQNLMGHVLLQSAESLALDAYATDKLTDELSMGASIRQFSDQLFGTAPANSAFFSRERWFDRKAGATARDWEQAVKTRFVGYIARGDTGTADELLRTLRITDGLEGVSFEGSNIVGSDLYIRATYQIEYFFNPFDMGKFKTSQQVCVRMWGASLEE